MKDNWKCLSLFWKVVVNCFQKLLSSWWRTTAEIKQGFEAVLWIAFKNYYLRDEGQLKVSFNPSLPSCELLSKIIIFVMKDNEPQKEPSMDCVVNCFQKLLSSWWRTTFAYLFDVNDMLWIAFKNYYLRDEGQRYDHWIRRRFSCELLSKIIIFVMKDNNLNQITKEAVVVNCFQKLLSSWWRTTKFLFEIVVY